MNWFKRKKEVLPEPPKPEQMSMPEPIKLPPFSEEIEDPRIDIPPQIQEDPNVVEQEPIEKEEQLPIKKDTLETYHKKEQPFFIQKSRFQEMLAEISDTDISLKEQKSTVDNISEIEKKQENQFEEIRVSLEDIERKLLYVDGVLFGE